MLVDFASRNTAGTQTWKLSASQPHCQNVSQVVAHLQIFKLILNETALSNKLKEKVKFPNFTGEKTSRACSFYSRKAHPPRCPSISRGSTGPVNMRGGGETSFHHIS